MNEFSAGKEAARAVIVWIVALLAGLLLKALGAGKWLSAAAGGVVALAAVA
jgi:hypothetical protein